MTATLIHSFRSTRFITMPVLASIYPRKRVSEVQGVHVEACGVCSFACVGFFDLRNICLLYSTHASCVACAWAYFSFHFHLQDVVVSVSVWIVAFAEYFLVLAFAQRRAV